MVLPARTRIRKRAPRSCLGAARRDDFRRQGCNRCAGHAHGIRGRAARCRTGSFRRRLCGHAASSRGYTCGKNRHGRFAVSAPGPTRNPWNLDHSPGGSSSGSAAAVAAGMVAMAIGTQTGGSIIRPAAFSGVIGFKPSFGRVPRTGMLVLCDSLDTIGWFTRDVARCRQVAEVFLGGMPLVDGRPDDTHDNVQGLRVAVLTSLDAGALEPAAMDALKVAAEDLAEHGAHTDWREERELITTALSVHGSIMAYELARGLFPVMQSEVQALRPQTLAVIERGLSISPDTYLELQQQRLTLQQSWAAKYAQYDVILTPSAPGTAPAGLTTTGSSVFNRTWSLLGWPSVHLPLLMQAACPWACNVWAVPYKICLC